MKTIFQAFARYNGSVNRSILEIVEPLKKEQVMMATKAYYPSIFETLLHNFIADLSWLKRYRDAFKEIIKTLICKILPNLPLPKGGITPLWKSGARGDFLMIMSIQF